MIPWCGLQESIIRLEDWTDLCRRLMFWRQVPWRQVDWWPLWDERGLLMARYWATDPTSQFLWRSFTSFKDRTSISQGSVVVRDTALSSTIFWTRQYDRNHYIPGNLPTSVQFQNYRVHLGTCPLIQPLLCLGTLGAIRPRLAGIAEGLLRPTRLLIDPVYKAI
jgi:hypothetical protein